MIYPAVMHFHKTLYTKYPFKDKRSTWRVSVFVSHPRTQFMEIVVAHLKGQESHEANAFSFAWELDVVLKQDESPTSELYIIKYDLGDAMKEPSRSDIVAYFESELHPNCIFQKIWSSLPPSIRTYRIVTNCTKILDTQGNILFKSVNYTPLCCTLLELTRAIAIGLDSFDSSSHYTKKANNLFLGDTFTSTGWQTMQSDTTFLRIIALLWMDILAMPQKIVRELFVGKFPLEKEGRRSSTLQFAENKRVTVCHKVIEHSSSAALPFEFCWQFAAEIDPFSDGINTGLQIVSYTFFDNMPYQDRMQWTLAAAPLLTDTTKEKKVVQIPAVALLQACCASLQSSPHSEQVVALDNLSAPVAVETALRSLLASLSHCHAVPVVSLKTSKAFTVSTSSTHPALHTSGGSAAATEVDVPKAISTSPAPTTTTTATSTSTPISDE